MAEVRTRPADAGDGELLFALLLEAMNWSPDRTPFTVRDVLSRPELAHYVAGWPRPGDAGVVAVAGAAAAVDDGPEEPLGAAWWRHFPADDPGYGFVDPSIPEVSIAVVPERRGGGVGTVLLAALAAEAQRAGLAALSLSVELANPAVRLYERAGYRRVGDDGSAATMRLDLPPSP